MLQALNKPNQIKPNQTKPTKPNLPNQTYQTKPSKFNLELLIEVKHSRNQNNSTLGSHLPLAMFCCESDAMKGFASLCGIKGNGKLANLTNYPS